jgi:putative ABC transport system ATP-binding protein
MAIQLTNVTFSYPESPARTVLAIDNWQVTKQEQVFVHGPSGGGKSTLLNMLSGIITPDSGDIKVFDTSLSRLNNRQRDRFRANHIGYIFQQFNLIPYLDAIDNVQLAHRFSKQQTQTAIIEEITTLLANFAIKPIDWHKPVAQLSIGQQQRIAIVRAMINKPELLIADEPTSSLDQKNRDNFMTELMTMVAEYKTTLLFVSHDMSLASHFNRIDALADINNADCSE